MKTISILAALVAAMTATAARAEDAKWGTPEQGAVCSEDCDYHAGWKNSMKPECKAEVDRRTKACIDDPAKKKEYDAWVKSYKDAKSEAKLQSLAESCADDAKRDVESSMDAYRDGCQKKRDDDARKAKLDATEVPKAELHDAKIEAAVKKAYENDYGNEAHPKVLKVVLEGWADDLETDAFGQVTGRDMAATVVVKQEDGKCSLHGELYMQRGHGNSFSGPFTSRGAGSASDTEIMCSKVEGKAAAAPAKPAAAPAKKKGK
jgi:hypothetical protein